MYLHATKKLRHRISFVKLDRFVGFCNICTTLYCCCFFQKRQKSDCMFREQMLEIKNSYYSVYFSCKWPRTKGKKRRCPRRPRKSDVKWYVGLKRNGRPLRAGRTKKRRKRKKNKKTAQSVPPNALFLPVFLETRTDSGQQDDSLKNFGDDYFKIHQKQRWSHRRGIVRDVIMAELVTQASQRCSQAMWHIVLCFMCLQAASFSFKCDFSNIMWPCSTYNVKMVHPHKGDRHFVVSWRFKKNKTFKKVKRSKTTKTL